MKQGNQFYLGIKLRDKNGYINIDSVEKIIFQIQEIEKRYPEEVEYKEGEFYIWLTQEDTFKMQDEIEIEARIKFTNNVILGSKIKNVKVKESLNKEVL